MNSRTINNFVQIYVTFLQKLSSNFTPLSDPAVRRNERNRGIEK